MELETINVPQNRKKEMKAVRNSLDVLSRKWSIAVLSSIYYHDTRRFYDLLTDIDGISNKVLSKELKKLESDDLVKRTIPGKHLWYELTEYGLTLKSIISKVTKWVESHRRN